MENRSGCWSHLSLLLLLLDSIGVREGSGRAGVTDAAFSDPGDAQGRAQARRGGAQEH